MSDLDHLAEALGIEPWFHDIWGNHTPVSDDTKRALIKAMGWRCESDEAVATSVAQLEARAWQRPLPPVLVLDSGGPHDITLTLAHADDDSRIRWTLAEETGAEQTGEVRLGDLEAFAQASIEGELYRRRRLPLPDGLPEGYHTLTLALPEGRTTSTRLIVAPSRCLTPDAVDPHGRLWGLSAQLYSLSSAQSWGMGDYADLGELAAGAANLGADMIGINPLHVLFSADPGHFSPYAPSGRSFLNVSMLSVPAIPEFAHSPEAQGLVGDPEFQARLEAARADELVDYVAVAALKRPVLEALFATFKTHHLGTAPSERGRAFQAFVAQGGAKLRKLSTFEALHEQMFRDLGGPWAWQEWPEPLRDADSPEVAAFAETHQDRLLYFSWLQFIADEQMAAAQGRARASGMRVGFYQDLAVANHPSGACAWADPKVVISGANVGAPPDLLARMGQNWGLAPQSPSGLIEAGYEPFISVLRATMRHAGAIRIDHVMSLQRLFWIPSGRPGTEGAYVRYPFHDLRRIVALESRRHRCLVIGEDLGTVPEGFRPALQETGVLAYKVLLFERTENDGFAPPQAYASQALVTSGTHDLVTLAGFWIGRDLEWRRRLGNIVDDEALARELIHRAHERMRLCEALANEGLLPQGTTADSPMTGELITAIQCYLARTSGAILMVPLEDALCLIEQPNMPGTTTAHPNWRRKLPVPVSALVQLPQVRDLAAAICAVRGHNHAAAAE